MKSIFIFSILILLFYADSCPQNLKTSLRHPGWGTFFLRGEKNQMPSNERNLVNHDLLMLPEIPLKRELNKNRISYKSDRGKYRPVKIIVDSTRSYSYIYDKKGFPAVEFGEHYDEGVLLSSFRCNRIFDNNGNLVAEIYMGSSDGQWLNSFRIINTYNNNNRILASSYELWKDNAWLKYYRYTYTYDAAGNPKSYLFEYFDQDPSGMGVWSNAERWFYTYDNNGNMLSDLLEYWQDGAWLSNYRRAYTYDKDKLASAVLEIFYDGTWRYSSRTANTYDAFGNLINYLWETYQDGIWKNREKSTHTYDNNSLLIASLTEKWKNNVWVNYSRFSRTTSGNGSAVTNLWELWKNNAWVDSSKCVETMDNKGNTIKAESFDLKNNSWISSRSYLNLSYNLGKDNVEYLASSVEAEYEYIKDEEPPLVHEFSLAQNYPNPFNSSTAINYSVKQDGMVRLSVYNILGSRVAVILDEYKAAGDYTVRLDGSNLPGGVYFYMLESLGRTHTKKFILLK